jgi:hypothetical protein
VRDEQRIKGWSDQQIAHAIERILANECIPEDSRHSLALKMCHDNPTAFTLLSHNLKLELLSVMECQLEIFRGVISGTKPERSE